jgi:hypothetical protein
MRAMSQSQPVPQGPDRTPVFIGVAGGLGANLAVYLVAWWVSKRTPNDWGGHAGLAPLVAFGQVVCCGTTLIVIASLVARTLLIRAGRMLLAKSLTISALLPIVLVPAIASINALIVNAFH